MIMTSTTDVVADVVAVAAAGTLGIMLHAEIEELQPSTRGQFHKGKSEETREGCNVIEELPLS